MYYAFIWFECCSGDVSEVKTHNVESESYSEEDIKAAIDTIKKEFKSDWKGCTPHRNLLCRR